MASHVWYESLLQRDCHMTAWHSSSWTVASLMPATRSYLAPGMPCGEMNCLDVSHISNNESPPLTQAITILWKIYTFEFSLSLMSINLQLG
jgi:hypothetical protein